MGKYRPVTRRLITALTAIIVVLSFTSRVYAHAQLVRSDPPDGAVLAQPPHELRMWFSEPIVQQFSSVRVVNGGGHEMPVLGLQSNPTESNLVALLLPDDKPLPDGVYSVIWKVLSADGHYTTGHSVFSVGATTTADTFSAQDDTLPIAPIEVILRWLNYSLLACATGGIAIAAFVLRPARKALREPEAPLSLALKRVERRINVWTGVTVFAALIVGVGWLVYQASILAGSGVTVVAPEAVVANLLGQTQWGTLWILREGLLAFSAVVVIRRIRSQSYSRVLDALACILIIAVLIVQTFIGHAATLQRDAAIAIAADVVHLFAIGAWVGGLIALGMGVLMHQAQPAPEVQRSEIVRVTWERFGLIAAVSVAAVFISGLYSTGRQVASIDALLTTAYGQAILIKIGGVLAAGAVGLLNSMLLHPRVAAPLARVLRKPTGWTPLGLRHLPSLVLGELSIGLLIFAAASVLTAAPPAHGPEFAPTPDFSITSASIVVNDMLVTFSAKPNLPGQNVMNISASSTRRPAPAEVLRVIVRMTYREKDIGIITADAKQIDPERYLLGGNYLSLAGTWRVAVVIRRKGIEDAVADFDWYVPTAAPRPVLVSNQPWESVLTLLSAALLLAMAAVIASAWARTQSSRTSTKPDSEPAG